MICVMIDRLSIRWGSWENDDYALKLLNYW